MMIANAAASRKPTIGWRVTEPTAVALPRGDHFDFDGNRLHDIAPRRAEAFYPVLISAHVKTGHHEWRGDDPRCPECGGPIGQTATYCMHCSTDLTDERAAADADGNLVWDQAEAGSATATGRSNTPPKAASGSGWPTTFTSRGILNALGISVSGFEEGDQLLAPDGFVDDTLTVAVGITGGIIVGVVGTVVLGILTESAWALPFGLVAWLGTTAYLVRRRTVQDAVAKSGYAVAAVLLLVPVIALSPTVSIDGGVADRGGAFLALLVFVAIPAGFAAFTGWIASRFVPTSAGESDG